jgi:hypothetical protein
MKLNVAVLLLLSSVSFKSFLFTQIISKKNSFFLPRNGRENDLQVEDQKFPAICLSGQSIGDMQKNMVVS